MNGQEFFPRRRNSVESLGPPPSYRSAAPPYSEVAPATRAQGPTSGSSAAQSRAAYAPWAPNQSAYQAMNQNQRTPSDPASASSPPPKQKDKPKSRLARLKEEQARYAASKYKYASNAEIEQMTGPRVLDPNRRVFERDPKIEFSQIHHEIRTGGRVQYASHAEIEQITGRDAQGFKCEEERRKGKSQQEWEKRRAQSAGSAGDCVVM